MEERDMAGTGRKLTRRGVLAGAAAGLARPALAQGKPEKLVFVGDNGPWHTCLVEEVAPAFQKATGIAIDFTLLPIDALIARLKAELSSGSNGIDIVQWGPTFAGWLTPHLEDHDKLLAAAAGRHPDFDWDDFLPAVRDMASLNGRLCGIPYRITTGVLHYQMALLEQVGITTPPRTWDELLKAAIATTKPGAPNRYGFGIAGRQGPAMLGHFVPFMRSNGGDYGDLAAGEIGINLPPVVEALEFYGDMMTKYKVIPPDALTWEFDEIIANGQKDRYAMSDTLAPYGTLINDAKLSQTGGRWSWSTVPGAKSPEQSRSYLAGWTLGVPSKAPSREWAFEFIQTACSKSWMRRSMERGNAPPRVSVLNDPEIVKRFGWAPAAAAALKTARLDPRDAFWPALDLQLRNGVSQVLLGQKTAKAALDGVADDWRRSMRRAGVAVK
jgi:ABC-type glycerol-3-phosphate transport system substrate-binding protein